MRHTQNITSRLQRRRQGSALIAVFWMIAVLGMVMYAGAKALDIDSTHARLMRGRTYAKRLAEMGMEVAKHPAIREDDPALHYQSPIGGGYNVKLVSEEARFNINVLLQSGDKVILRRLFTRWGFTPEFTSAVLDALKDWVDADENVSLNGAEKREYDRAGLEGMPFNRPFKEVDEMLLVRGMDAVNLARPDWREWFTVYGDGRVDVNDARAELISVLADVPMERVAPILTFRVGQDGILNTRDDGRLSSVPQFAQMLGVFQPQIVQLLTQWVQFQGPIRRIESIGALGDVSRKFVLIMQNNRALWRGEIPAYGKES